MTLSEILRQALATFRSHKMRTFLTMFGIVWGIASVILLVGLGRRLSVNQTKHMQTLGKDLVVVWGGRTSSQVGVRAPNCFLDFDRCFDRDTFFNHRDRRHVSRPARRGNDTCGVTTI